MLTRVLLGHSRLGRYAYDPGVTGRADREQSAARRREALKEVYAQAQTCVRCAELAATRKTVVFGAGNADAELMFVGEAPGRERGRAGLPFVGQAGKLLETLLGEIGMARAEVFIANVLKCRPPGNRDPQPVEIENCQDYLYRQVELIQPRVICTLGNFSTKLLREDPTGITRVHGQPEVLHAGQARGAALPDLPSGRRAVHAAHAGDAARGLRAPAGAARAGGARPSRSTRLRRASPFGQPERSQAPEPEIEELAAQRSVRTCGPPTSVLTAPPGPASRISWACSRHERWPRLGATAPRGRAFARDVEKLRPGA